MLARLGQAIWAGLSLIVGVVLGAILMPFIALFQLTLWLLGYRRRCTPEELASDLIGFRDGTLRDDELLDLEAPIKDERLEAIRAQALSLKLPLDDEGRATITQLLARLEAI